MGRRPCCEKMGLKKGPWSAEEDRILISHIRLHGHPNWRALPQLAGLLRCGKSCRLRWINYLRPDIKRGNFTPQEEETIINLHQSLGNRWSAIAAKLPGRTDNEIKNVWHTHLKKRVKHNQDSETTCDSDKKLVSVMDEKRPSSPQQQSSISTNISAVTTSSNNNDVVSNNNSKDSATSPEDVLPLIDESFWSEVVSMDCNISGDDNKEQKIENWESSLDSNIEEYKCNHDMESWFDNLLTGSLIVCEISDISEF